MQNCTQCAASIMQILISVVLVFVGVSSEVKGGRNNVCPTIEDYFTMDENPNCWYDVAADFEVDVPGVIRERGYPVEIHQVQTLDGYILTLHRIPNSRHPNPKQFPVFLQHGLVANSANFATPPKNISMALILADAGYDVWMGNYRGTTYSQGHVNLTVRNNEYWDHSIDHLGLLDMPAMINKVIEVTGKRGDIILVGHSLGTTLSMIYTSSFPEEARRNLKFLVLLAPAASLRNMISPYRLFAPLAESILTIINANDLVRVTSSSYSSGLFTKTICLDSPITMERCMQIFNLFYGPSASMGKELYPVFFRHTPAGSSIRVVRHAADFVLGRFGMYDYGKHENLRRYGSYKPPSYDTMKIKVPTLVMYALNDWACGAKDARELLQHLSPDILPFGAIEVRDRNFNHMDFLYGKRSKEIVTDRLIRLFDRLHKLP